MKYLVFLKVIVTLIYCQLSVVSLAQENFISGVLIDSDTEEPLAFVNLGVKAKWKGTVSTFDGKFTISTNDITEFDTLEISKLGYKKEVFIFRDLISQNQEGLIIRLKSTLIDLPEFTLESSSYGKSKTFGALPKSSIFAYAFSPQNVPFTESFGREITISINPKSEKLLLDTIRINFSRLEVNSLTLRVNAYKDEEGKPGEKFFESLWEIENKGTGMYEITLGELGVYFDQNSFISIELVSVGDQKKFGIITIPVSVSLGNHFVRLSSLGEWTKAKGNPSFQVIFKKT